MQNFREVLHIIVLIKFVFIYLMFRVFNDRIAIDSIIKKNSALNNKHDNKIIIFTFIKKQKMSKLKTDP